MVADPIVEEVQQARARIFTECGEDLGKLVEHLRAAEEQDRARLVTVDLLRQRRGKKGSGPPAAPSPTCPGSA